MSFVSFILPAYKARFLKQAIKSILNQSYLTFELVIIDDTSPENIEEIVLSFDDSRIKYVRNEKNIGGENLVKQWNHCLQFAQGEYVVMAADDDLYHPDFLKECIWLAQKYPEVDIIRVGAKQIDEQNRLIGIDGIIPEKCSKYQFLYYWLQAMIFTCIGNYMFRATTIKEKQFIDFPSAFGSDTATTIMLAENGIANSAKMFFSFRLSTIHLSSNMNKLDEKLEANSLLFEWLRNLNYEKPLDNIDQLMFEWTRWPNLYIKCKYDYYNLVIKHLPFYQFYYIGKCRLLSKKDKMIMFLRFCLKKMFR